MKQKFLLYMFTKIVLYVLYLRIIISNEKAFGLLTKATCFICKKICKNKRKGKREGKVR